MSFEPTLFVIDDDAAVLRSLEWLLETLRLPLQTFANSDSFLNAYDGRPGCVVLDVRMPGMNGLELQKWLGEQHPHLPIILLTAHGDVPMAVRAMRAGAYDFIQKPYNGQAILDCVQAAVREARRRQERRDEIGTLTAGLAKLTRREREVLDLVAAGKPNKAIARRLEVSVRTVEVHRHNLMRKLDAQTVGDLIRIHLLAGDSPL